MNPPLTCSPSLLPVSLFTFFSSHRLVSASKPAQECVCPLPPPLCPSLPLSPHPTLHFLYPSSPKYWLAVLVALCVNCCCWQVWFLNRRKSKEREASWVAGWGARWRWVLEGILAGLFVLNCTTMYFPAVCFSPSCHNTAVFSSPDQEAASATL